jgi:hypothetical protein
MVLWLQLLMVASLALAVVSGSARADDGLVVDDFSDSDGISALGTFWRGFTDRVMGGVSEASTVRTTMDGVACLRLQGDVSLDNNGGFVQVALSLSSDGGGLDASGYRGLRIVVRGNGEPGYYVHLRTEDTRRPWQYYQARFDAPEEWTEIDIPFDSFRPENLGRPLDTNRLTRIGVVAAKRAFRADVAVARISFYR